MLLLSNELFDFAFPDRRRFRQKFFHSDVWSRMSHAVGMFRSDVMRTVCGETGMSISGFERRMTECDRAGLVAKSFGTWRKTERVP